MITYKSVKGTFRQGKGQWESNEWDEKQRDNIIRLGTQDKGNELDFAEASLRTKGGGTYGVNWKTVKSKEYTKRFDQLSDNSKANALAAKRARNALVHRDGKKTEELYAISLTTGKDVSKITDQHYDFGIKRTKKFNSDVFRAEERNELVLLIHNHPRGLTPSRADLNELLRHNNVVGVTAGHDGSIYYYTKPNKKISEFDFQVAYRREKEYNGILRYEKTLERLSEEFGFDFRKL